MGLITAIKNRGPLWVTANGSLWLFDRFFEYGLYPYAEYRCGVFLGTALMMALSAVICWLFIVLYDYVSNNWVRDALGLESVKEAWSQFELWVVGIGDLAVKIKRTILSAIVCLILSGPIAVASFLALVFVGWCIHRLVLVPVTKKWVAALPFLYFSLFWDPMTTLIMLRPSHAYSMGVREWKIFCGSVFVSNASWGVLVWVGVESFRGLFMA